MSLVWLFAHQMHSKPRWNLNVYMWFTFAQDVKQHVSVCESSGWILRWAAAHYTALKAALIESQALLWFVPVAVSLCVWAACERGTFWTLNHRSRIWDFHLLHLCVGLMLVCGCCTALEIQFQYFQSVVVSFCFTVWCNTLTLVCPLYLYLIAELSKVKNNIVNSFWSLGAPYW